MTSENEIKKKNLKMFFFDEFPYEELKKVCDSICKLGYDAETSENGCMIFTRRT